MSPLILVQGLSYRYDDGTVALDGVNFRLEQGETMIAFVVQPDGRLAGPVRVTKSAGFDEFDRAAIEAIRLVTPFPPIPRPPGVDRASALPISLRVTFSNPVIR